MNNTVSIVVPVYNAAACIADTIMSVMGQTYTDYELLLVDDGSDDESTKIIGKYVSEKVKLLSNRKEKGAAGARNTGIEEARGRYIAFLDADDLWVKDKLSRQVGFMKTKDAVFSFTGYEFADENAKGLGKVVHVPDKITYKEALCNTTIFTSTVMFDMTRLTKEDIMMPNVKSEDTATWWKVLKKKGCAYGLDENLTLYRRMGRSLSSNKIEALRRIWNLYRKVEHLSIIQSLYCFFFWAIRAVARRV